MRVDCTVNGERRRADDVWPGESLLYVLRERLGLPGAKNACEQGECGSCTVYLDGLPVCACLVAAGQAEGADIVTVEGLPAAGQPLDPVQRAFLETGAVQCGFCTPGLIVAVHDLLQRDPRPTDPDIREALAGNLCRCTGYEMILDAVRQAAESLAAECLAAESRAGESRAGESRAAESRAGESRAGESRAGESRAAESRAGESRAAATGAAQP